MTLPTITQGMKDGRYFARFTPPGYIDSLTLFADTQDEALEAAWEYLDTVDRMSRQSATSIDDPVEHPAHYTRFGAEVIEITEHLNFCRGNAVKYLARAGAKDPSRELEDLQKALWYVQREIDRLRRA